MAEEAASQEIEAARYQILGCEITLMVGQQGGQTAQEAAARACRRLGTRLAELVLMDSRAIDLVATDLGEQLLVTRMTELAPAASQGLGAAGALPLTVADPVAAAIEAIRVGPAPPAGTPPAHLLARGRQLEEPPTSRPRLRSPEHATLLRHGMSAGGVGGSGETRPAILVDPEEIGTQVMSAVVTHQPRVPLPVHTMVMPRRGHGVAGLFWEFNTEQEAFAFRAGVLRVAARPSTTARRAQERHDATSSRH